MKQYLDLLRDVNDNGVWKEPARPGMPRTKEVFGRMIKFDLQQGFPLLTTKKMHFKGIITELLWFISGNTNIKYLIDNGCNIWNQDAYKYYIRLHSLVKENNNDIGCAISIEEFINNIKNEYNKYSIQDSCFKPFMHENINVYVDKYGIDIANKIVNYVYGDCGDIYGKQWRNYTGNYNSTNNDTDAALNVALCDQMSLVIDNIKNNPYSRYHVISAWNPFDFISPSRKISHALPACHMMFQLSVRDGYLDIIMTQRSTDTFLGLPYNIASYALLTHIIASECDLKPGVFTWVGNSVHIYENHIEQVNEILLREPYDLCKLIMNKKSIYEYNVNDFSLDNYKSHESLKAPLSVGI